MSFLMKINIESHISEPNDYIETAHEEYNDYRCQWIHRTPDTE